MSSLSRSGGTPPPLLHRYPGGTRPPVSVLYPCYPGGVVIREFRTTSRISWRARKGEDSSLLGGLRRWQISSSLVQEGVLSYPSPFLVGKPGEEGGLEEDLRGGLTRSPGHREERSFSLENLLTSLPGSWQRYHSREGVGNTIPSPSLRVAKVPGLEGSW